MLTLSDASSLGSKSPKNVVLSPVTASGSGPTPIPAPVITPAIEILIDERASQEILIDERASQEALRAKIAEDELRLVKNELQKAREANLALRNRMQVPNETITEPDL